MAVGAGALFGLAFLIPELLSTVSPVEVTYGRYAVYGLLSGALLARARPRLDREVWRTALLFALTGNVGYYLLLVIGIQGAGAPLAALIIGALPVTVALAGARGGDGPPVRRLLAPLALIAAGLGLVNLVALTRADAVGAGRPAETLVGVLAALGGLALWTWYALANAAFLRRRTDVTPATWSSAVGLATLAVVAVTGPPLLLASGGELSATEDLAAFLAGSLVLGVLVSWAASALWNRAALRLPVSLAGQLFVVETLAGLAYSYAARAALPDLATVVGAALLVAGVLLGLTRARAG
jgi:drug/metabolite transporter (DMT)-like permease